MNESFQRVQRLIAAIGHRSRFELFLRLAEREHTVGELAEGVGLSQSCTTRHLQAMARAGVVRAQRDGKCVRVRLRLERSDVARLLAWARLEALESVAPAHAGYSPSEGESAPRKARTRMTPARARPPRTAAAPEPPADPVPVEPGEREATNSDTTTAPDAPPEVRPRRSDLEDFLL